MIKRCDKPGCGKAGVCRAPKNRDLKEYWNFCKEHAEEYNKNWNYYSNMSESDIESDWEKRTFGSELKDADKAKKDSTDYAKFINDFLSGRETYDHAVSKPVAPSTIISALSVFELGINSSWREISAKYRMLAKKYHPDTNADKPDAAEKFTKISTAYKTLEEYYKKKKA